jgi:hypothetical protein
MRAVEIRIVYSFARHIKRLVFPINAGDVHSIAPLNLSLVPRVAQVIQAAF